MVKRNNQLYIHYSLANKCNYSVRNIYFSHTKGPCKYHFKALPSTKITNQDIAHFRGFYSLEILASFLKGKHHSIFISQHHAISLCQLNLCKSA